MYLRTPTHHRNFFFHVARMTDDKTAEKAIEKNFDGTRARDFDGTRARGRARKRWMDGWCGSIEIVNHTKEKSSRGSFFRE